MREISPALKARFAREDLSICRCVILRLKNGQSYFLTDLNRSIKVGNDTFKPEPCIDVSAIRTAKDTAGQNAEIMLSYEEEGLAERPIRFGLINDAICEIYWVDYLMPQLGKALMLAGKVAAVEQPRKTHCVMKVQAASSAGSSVIIAEVYSKRCRNIFGDKRCKVNIDALSVPFTVIQTFPDLAQFAVNGYSDFIPPDDEEYEPPTENGEYKQYEKGEFEFDVPNSQILKIRLSSSGGGGATGGGGLLGLNGETLTRPGQPGNDAFPMTMTRTTRGNLELFNIGGGKGGSKFLGYDSKTSKVGDYIDKLLTRPNPGADGILINGLPGATYSPNGAKGGAGNNGRRGSSNQLPEGLGGNGGNGGLVEYIFNLQDPACPIKAGDRIHFSNGSAGDSPKYDFPQPSYFDDPEGYLNYTNPGDTGRQGFFELTWQSNTGEPILEKTFDLGTVLWTKGDNTGQVNSIAANTTGLITLSSNPRLPIDVGDEGLFRPGCSNFADMCEDRWNNLINMQAEPVTPQGVTTAPSPITDTQTDLTKPTTENNLDYFNGGGSISAS